MECPACDNTLTEKEFGGIAVDVCENGCGGIWFDNFELEKFDEQHEHAGEALLDVARDPDVQANIQEKRQCPRCQDVVMRQRFFSVKRGVTMDECAGCGGIWLDAGELRDIRKAFENEEQRHQAFDTYFQSVLGEQLSSEISGQRSELADARKFAHAFRYILPSYYIPGEQKGGAF
ncbi:MAG: zf-TFIIB domain-containing protein [Candidatus Omnitrophota bacterium]